MNYKIELYDESKHYADLVRFTEQAAIDEIDNNSSIKKLSLKEESGMFLTYYNDIIISLCHTHDFSNYYPGAWRVYARTATLTAFRGVGFPRRAGQVCCAGLNSHTVPFQVDYAKKHGARVLLWTTNISGNGLGFVGSAKLDRHLKKYVCQDPTYEYYDEKEIYGVKQTVWKLNYRDIINIEGEI
jgi:hypothetical protein